MLKKLRGQRTPSGKAAVLRLIVSVYCNTQNSKLPLVFRSRPRQGLARDYVYGFIARPRPVVVDFQIRLGILAPSTTTTIVPLCTQWGL